MKKTTLTALIFLCLLVINCQLSIVNAQTQRLSSIGGAGDESANSIKQTTDGGYVMAGKTSSFGAGNSDMYIVKFNASGVLQWSRTVGGTGNDEALSIIQTTDGGYAVAGATNSFGAGIYDMYIVKLDGSGMFQWSRTIGGAGNDGAYSIKQTTDGGYVVAGNTSSFGAGGNDMYIVKLDAIGTMQWSRNIGGTGADDASSVIQTTDGGYVMAGSTVSFGAGIYDMYIVKLDGSGTLQWSRTVGGTSFEGAYSIIQTTDGGFAVSGYTQSFGAGGADMYIVKLSSSGALLLSRTIGGTNMEYANSIIQTTDGGFAVTGFTASFGAGNNDTYIVKLDGSGTIQWSRSVGGTGSEVARSIIQTTDGGFAMAGYTLSFGAGGEDMYIVKFDASVNICGNSSSPTSISNTGGTLGTPTSTVNTPNPTVSLPASLTGTGGTVTGICATAIQTISNEIPNQFSLSQNYPNPFNPVTNIEFAIPKSSFVKLVVYDMLGREVEMLVSKDLKAGTYKADWDASKYTSGVYFYSIQTEGFTETRKMILVK